MAKRSTTKKKAKSKSKSKSKKKSVSKQESQEQIDNVIQLEDLPILNLTEDQKNTWRGVRDGFEVPAKKAFTQALENPTVLGITDNLNEEMIQALQYIEYAEQLEPIQQWLEKKLEVVSESRLYYRGVAKKAANKVVQRARLVEKESPGSASEYSDLIDFYSKPAQKGRITRRKNKKKKEQD